MLYSSTTIEKGLPVTFLTEDEKMMKETGWFIANSKTISYNKKK